MSLRWNIGNVDNMTEVCYREYCDNCEQYWPPDAPCESRWGKKFDEHKKALNEDGEPKYKLHYVTEALIFATMSVDIGQITQDNWKEFFTRLRLTEMVWGKSIVEKGKERYITAEEVRQHIGLSANVSKKAESTFLKKVYGQLKNDLRYEIKEAVNV